MEHGDIGSYATKRAVVIMEPLVWKPPVDSVRLAAARRLSKWQYVAEQYTLNGDMLTWINWMGREHSVPTEVWSFLPSPLFDILMLTVDRVAGGYVSTYRNFASMREAVFALRGDPDILGVYDADPDRVDLYWHLRGVKVVEGTTP